MDRYDNKSVWPGWETVRLIGRGSYGAVYEIRRTIAGEEERAAVKRLSIPMDESEIRELRMSFHDEDSIARRFSEQKERFVREYSTMARLKGASHIVYCDDFRTEPHADGIGWDIFIKMELLTPLEDVLRKPMEEKEILHLGRDIAKALSSCHRENILHRDVKPQNIFVNREGEYKLGDFGVARSMEGTGSASLRTGTYRYMAPEIFNGERYGPRADLYSLGMVLYWLLNRRRQPFLPPEIQYPTGEEERESSLRRFRGEALPPPADGSEGFQRIVLKACAFDPLERFLSAEEMLEALESLGEPGNDRPSAPAEPGPRRPESAGTGEKDRRERRERRSRESRRLPLLTGIIGAAAVLLAVLLVLVLRGGRPGQGPAESPAPPAETALPTQRPEPAPTASPEPSPPEAEATPEPLRYTRQQILDDAARAAESMSDYRLSSRRGFELLVPEESAFLSSPFQMKVEPSTSGYIYIMPRPDEGDVGHLGTIRHGTTVTVLAEYKGFYFFVAPDGRAGWNGSRFFSEP